MLKYKSLNDAKIHHPKLAQGPTKIWYARLSRDLGMGYDWCKEHGCLPNKTTPYK